MFLLFLIIYLYFLILAVTEKIIISTPEIVTSIGMPTKEEKSKIETHLVVTEAKIS